ncbi:MAG: hypothetical protein H0U76_21945 [Ktedonobacteraceae bacterium]|nr:hypothetical protein [Ktedonobacteraceae bacterium]
MDHSQRVIALAQNSKFDEIRSFLRQQPLVDMEETAKSLTAQMQEASKAADALRTQQKDALRQSGFAEERGDKDAEQRFAERADTLDEEIKQASIYALRISSASLYAVDTWKAAEKDA